MPDVVIQDQRGPDGALFVFRGEGQDGSCLVLRGADGVLRDLGVGHGIWFGEGSLEGGTHSRTTAGRLDTWTISENVGTYPDGTERVTIGLDDGTTIESTVSEGRSAAWWPSDAEVVETRALESTGATIEAIRPDQ